MSSYARRYVGDSTMARRRSASLSGGFLAGPPGQPVVASGAGLRQGESFMAFVGKAECPACVPGCLQGVGCYFMQ